MITVISSTNRPGSMTLRIAEAYVSFIREQGGEVSLLSLERLPSDLASGKSYGVIGPDLQSVLDQYIVPADKLVFVVPEYNGSYPGILKLFFDASHPRFFREKKAGIIGVSDGHAGNLRGLEHLTGVLHYMRMMVHFSQPKLSAIDAAFDSTGILSDERAIRLLQDHAQRIVRW